jgi:competence protein ComEA
MFWIKRWVKDFFFLSHSQVNGFVVLVPLLAIVLFSAPAWQWFVSQQPKDYSKDRATLDSLIALWDESRPEKVKDHLPDDVSKRTFTLFDPNQATADELILLGFSNSLSKRMVHYREKGGTFRIKSDLLKIYGMDSSLYQQLYSFIDLPVSNKLRKADHPAKRPSRSDAKATFDLNLADTSQLKSIYGIGEKLSLRIIRYRDALGGFVSMEQVLEVYGLDTTVVNRMAKASYIREDFQPRKLNINKADEKELAAHPYLRKTAARSIVAYRFQHGEFTALEDLGNIHTLDPNTIEKIIPYLTIED